MAKSDWHSGDEGVYRRVADLHIACMPDGFLTTLGPRFLSLMYQAIDEGESSVLILSREGDQIAGFVAASSSMAPIYRGMLQHWPRLFSALLPSLFLPRRLRRILEIVRYSSSRELPVNRAQAELLSIGVDAPFRGRGHADQLYEDLCEHCRRRGIPEFKIVVGVTLEQAHRFYRRMGALPADQIEVHKGQTSKVYIQAVKWTSSSRWCGRLAVAVPRGCCSSVRKSLQASRRQSAVVR